MTLSKLIETISHGLKQTFEEINNIRHHYPRFVGHRTNILPIDSIPIFVFHTIVPEIFKSQIEYLKRNGYTSITCDAFYQYMSSKEPIPPKTVMLTIDDGRQSIEDHGIALIKEYKMPVVVFLIPGLLHEKNQASSSQDAESLLSWESIQKMHQTGLVDFQSHSFYHRRIFKSPIIRDFLSPDNVPSVYDRDFPLDLEQRLTDIDLSDLYGMPLYESSSLFDGRVPYLDDRDLRKACIEFYSSIRKEPLWKNQMFKFVADYKRSNPDKSSYLSNLEYGNLMRSDLIKSRERIEEKLGKKVRHFCYPYTLHCAASSRMAEEAGFLTHHCGVLAYRPDNKRNANLFHCVRLKNDFIHRLPGEGRKSLFSIFLLKALRRLQGKTGY
jgi:peptidoglycan/xylan/chitin deacetylase (PgdA/CDA1 family)